MTRPGDDSVHAVRFQRNAILCAVVLAGFVVVVSANSSTENGAEPAPRRHPDVRTEGFEPVDFPEGNAELQRLAQRFGVKHYSWHYEEWFIRDFFDDMRDGVFVDVGANHYSKTNNTFYLEHVLGWGGIAIDAQEKFRSGYQQHRPRTKYFTYFVSDKSTGQAKLFVPEDIALASGTKESLQAQGQAVEKTIEIAEITLNDLLDSEGVEKVDFLSMDIELAEPAALRGFDIKRFAPKLVCIEEFEYTRDEIEAYFRDNGYAKIELWSRIDGYNSYYVPAELVEAGEVPGR